MHPKHGVYQASPQTQVESRRGFAAESSVGKLAFKGVGGPTSTVASALARSAKRASQNACRHGGWARPDRMTFRAPVLRRSVR